MAYVYHFMESKGAVTDTLNLLNQVCQHWGVLRKQIHVWREKGRGREGRENEGVGRKGEEKGERPHGHFYPSGRVGGVEEGENSIG